MLISLVVSEVVCYCQGSCLSGGFGSKNSGPLLCQEMSLYPTPGNTSFLCNILAAQVLMLPSAAKARF